MASIASMYKDPAKRKGITNTKQYQVPVEKIYIEKGFNVRDIDKEHVEQLAAAYKRGDYVPPLVVEVQDNESGSMKLIDGHHRYSAIKLLLERGEDFKRVTCESFHGDMADQIAFMIQSSQGRNLSPLERGEAYKRMLAYGYTIQEIAERLTRSVSDVTKAISIAELNHETKELIKTGKIQAHLALEMAGAEGEAAIHAAVKQARKEGKKKVTKSMTSMYKASMGKSVVQAIRMMESVATDDGGATVTFDKDSWALVNKALAALSTEK